jgi:hypothetical protein
VHGNLGPGTIHQQVLWSNTITLKTFGHCAKMLVFAVQGAPTYAA